VRDDQYIKLKALSEKLTDVALIEADPANWSGEGADLSKAERGVRGDRYWCKKNAAATLTMLMKIHSLTGMIERGLLLPPAEPAGDGGESDLDKEVRAAEREATSLLKQIQKRQRDRTN